jgi:hypothetical protein
MGGRKAEQAALRFEWHAHRKAAPYSSDEWAASDRGWYRAYPGTSRMSEVMHDESVCLGHYLDYEHKCDSAPDGKKTVHAVSTVTRESSYHATPEAARQWLESEARGREFEYVLSMLRQKGTYEHVIDELRKRYGKARVTA